MDTNVTSEPADGSRDDTRRRLVGPVRDNGGLLNEQEVAKWLGIPPGSVRMHRYRKTGPPFARIGRHVRYRAADIARWIDEQMVSS
jgi:predicted DNA-binding transcriptional regulator AlpA